MARIHYDADADPKLLEGRVIAVLGYGSQGHAQAQNLRERGMQVIVGVREGRTARDARSDGFAVHPLAEAVRRADVVQILLPDEAQRDAFAEAIGPNLRDGMAIGFSHGFNVHYGQVVAPRGVDVFMVAPKSPGTQVRCEYEMGRGVPCLIAVY